MRWVDSDLKRFWRRNFLNVELIIEEGKGSRISGHDWQAAAWKGSAAGGQNWVFGKWGGKNNRNGQSAAARHNA